MQQVPLAYVPSPAPRTRVVPLDGEVAFASEEEQEQRSVELLGAGALLVRLPPPTSHVRGHLGGLLEELVERELARAGAPSPYLAEWTAMPDEANARLADQLLRARAVGASGLAIALGTLAHIAEPSLCPDDSAILRWLAEATTALPLVLLIDDADMHRSAYAAPRPLMDLLVQHDAPVILSGEDATAIEAVVASIDVAEALAATPSEPAPDTTVDALPNADAAWAALPNRDAGADAEADAEKRREVLALPNSDAVGAPCAPLFVAEEPARVEPVQNPLVEAGAELVEDAAAAVGNLLVEAGASGEESRSVLELDLADALTEADAAEGSPHALAANTNVDADPRDDADATTHRLPRTRRASGASLLRAVMTPPAPTTHSAEQIPAEDRDNPTADAQARGARTDSAAQSSAENRANAGSDHDTTAQPPRTAASRSAEPRRPRTARSAVAGAFEANAINDAWRAWALALSAARGAQPLAAFEKLFTESYVPLAHAIAGGLDDPRAVRAYDEFRRSFERSYTDAFATFGATNRRPRLVMDTFDLAIKNARLVGARSAHILLVDSMRYDLGAMVKEALGREASGVATLQSETLLWSALPTTTMRQLETLARGMDAIRAPAVEEPSESLRGRAAEVVRRFRLGSREIFKLDLVPSLLEAAGANAMTELPAIGQSVAEAIARHVTTLVPRTLLFVVGDHGFSIDRRGQIQTGGASPEEVLVPAQSWLIGDLH